MRDVIVLFLLYKIKEAMCHNAKSIVSIGDYNRIPAAKYQIESYPGARTRENLTRACNHKC